MQRQWQRQRQGQRSTSASASFSGGARVSTSGHSTGKQAQNAGESTGRAAYADALGRDRSRPVHHDRNCGSGTNNRPHPPLHSPGASTTSKPGYSRLSLTNKTATHGGGCSEGRRSCLLDGLSLRLHLERIHVAQRSEVEKQC